VTPFDGQSTAGSLSYGLAAIEPPIPMLILERELRIRWISQAAIKEFGVQPEQIVGRSWYDLFPESQARRALHDALFRGERAAVDLPRIALTMGCRTRYFSLHLRPLRAADGTVESILGLGEDVTTLVEAEHALRTSEERFRAISMHSRDMVLISAADGTLTFESAAVEHILGPRRTPRPVITIYDNMHPDDLPLAQEIFEKLVKDPAVGRERDIEIRKRHEDGSWRWLHVTASNLLDDPAVRGIVLNARDVTDRRRAEEALRQSEQRLRAVVEGMPVLMDAFDEQNLLVAWNKECERVTGYNAQEMIGNPKALEILYPDPKYRSRMLSHARRNVHWAYRDQGWDMRCKDGSICTVEWINVGAAIPIAGWHVWGVGIDVTAKRRLEKAVRSAGEREQRRLGHELHDGLGQELAGLSLLAHSLAQGSESSGPELRQKLRRLAQIAASAVRSCREIAHGLAPVSDARNGLIEALRELINLRAIEGCGAKINLKEQCSADLTITIETQNHLYRVAQEALNNAIKHAGARHVQVELSVDPDTVRLSVLDDGRGLLADAPPVTGLGFKTMRDRAAAMGARLSIAPPSGGGTAVIFECANRADNSPALD